MRKNGFICIVILMYICIGITSCSHEDGPYELTNTSKCEQLFRSMSELPTISIISETKVDSRSVFNAEFVLPCFSTEDLEYLSSLSQEEFERFYHDLLNQLGENGIERIEEIRDENYTRIFNIMNGHDGMTKLKDFAIKYIDSTGGWDSFQDLLPDNLTEQQSNIFVGIAVFIDKVSRPVYLTILSSPNYCIQSRGNTMCDIEAGIKLSLAGVDIGVDGLVDIMTGGTDAVLTPLEDVAIGADLASIWMDYEICNGRWH